ncbi:hypothetical protein VULLAG_LOCUS20120 [Vulpes lagopus]
MVAAFAKRAPMTQMVIILETQIQAIISFGNISLCSSGRE